MHKSNDRCATGSKLILIYILSLEHAVGYCSDNSAESAKRSDLVSLVSLAQSIL